MGTTISNLIDMEEVDRMRYEAPRGQRIKSRFIGIRVKGLWYYLDSEVWGEAGILQEVYTNIKPCRSIRAFKRFVRKHPEFKGKMTLLSRFVGHHVYA